MWGCSFVSDLKLRSTSSAEKNFADEITWITWKTEQNLEILPFLNSRLQMWICEKCRTFFLPIALFDIKSENPYSPPGIKARRNPCFPCLFFPSKQICLKFCTTQRSVGHLLFHIHDCLGRADTGSRINIWTFSQTHISKSELKNGHFSRFCSVFQVIQEISSAKFSLRKKLTSAWAISWIWIHESDFKGFFLEKRPWKSFFIKCSDSGINESTPQTQSNVIWISSKAHLKISFLNSRSEEWVWESSPKIDPATGVRDQAGIISCGVGNGTPY